MKLKRLVQDFQVEEQVSLRPGRGSFGLYRLTKESLGTLEAIAAICRRWKLGRNQLAFAGLKDRHALTSQFLTIQGGPRRGWSEASLSVEYIGQTDRPIHASDIVANRFIVVVRELGSTEAKQAVERLTIASHDGLPNYFDNQRFGSLGESGEFIARPWCQGNYERALWLALAEPNVHDSPADREQKRVLREQWGDWTACRAAFPESDLRKAISHLVMKPGDFRRALALVQHDLRSLWLAAFQSHLWNQVLAETIELACPAEQLTRHEIGRRKLPFFHALNVAQRGNLRQLILPLPSARLHLADGPLKSLYDRACAAEGLELREVRVKYPRDSFFSKGNRPAVFLPGETRHEIADDELYAGQHKLTLDFTLPRGSYATILTKQIVGGSEDLACDD